MASVTTRTNKKGETTYLIRVGRGMKPDGTRSTGLSETFTPEKGLTKRQIEKQLQLKIAELEKKHEQGQE